MSDDETTFNTRGLKDLIKALSGKLPTARVGVLGQKDARPTGKVNSNATVGASHEFGTSKLPQRSFLRVPITEHLNNYLTKSGAFTPEVLAQVIKDKTIKPWISKVAIIGEAIVSDAFDSGGFGKWKASNMKLKKNRQTLVETQQLRNSITSDVVE